jgi:hypothetical protein
MFRDIDQDDKRVTPIKVHKRFVAQKFGAVDNTPYLGVMFVQGIKPTATQLHQFDTGSNAGPTASMVSGGVTYKKYSYLVWQQTYHMFFKYANTPNDRGTTSPQPQFVFDKYHRPWGRNTIMSSSNTVPDYATLRLRQFHNQFNVFSIPQRLYGEGIKTGSVEITDYSTDDVITIKDDGYGNLYDSAYEVNYLSGSLTSNSSGSAVGVVNYDLGLVVITDTGSYGTVGTGTGSNGWKVAWDSTKTIQEYEFTCVIPPFTFNRTRNISVTAGRSGSMNINASVSTQDNYYWKGDSYVTQSAVKKLSAILPSPAESMYNTSSAYTAATDVQNFATHSFFAPYVTSIGLYNDFNELLAVAKISKPVRNDPELALSFVVRFDI